MSKAKEFYRVTVNVRTPRATAKPRDDLIGYYQETSFYGIALAWAQEPFKLGYFRLTSDWAQKNSITNYLQAQHPKWFLNIPVSRISSIEVSVESHP